MGVPLPGVLERFFLPREAAEIAAHALSILRKDLRLRRRRPLFRKRLTASVRAFYPHAPRPVSERFCAGLIRRSPGYVSEAFIPADSRPKIFRTIWKVGSGKKPLIRTSESSISNLKRGRIEQQGAGANAGMD
jgi:hypothetical protein